MTKQDTQKPDSASPVEPGFFRYFAAIFYDLMLVIALFFVATAVLLPLTQGEAIQSKVLYPLYLLTCSFFFYAWFWTHGGQTLGLRAWKIRVISDEHQADITWKQALIRYLTTLCTLGLGMFWRIWQKDSKSWQDLSSKSSIVFINKD